MRKIPPSPADPLQESSFSAVDGLFNFPTKPADRVSLFIRCKLSPIYFLLLLKASVLAGIASGNGLELKIPHVCRPRHARKSLFRSTGTGVRLYYTLSVLSRATKVLYALGRYNI